MNFDRRKLIALASFAGFETLFSPSLLAEQPPHNLYRVSDPTILFAATRALILQDTITTFITLDANGHPRARSVLASAPDEDLSIWIGTRKGSRKLEQLAANPAATLHFNDDANGAYVSLMGEAHAHTDAALIAVKNPYKGDMIKSYFPQYPADFVLIGFKPHWLEVMTADLRGKPETWQPEGVTT
ncbi:general stress protein 26 [Granulicella aggregans]|uniref:General stress protein 26 n=1 Tax=Granulicella aggregans TaxID=474949 RepID=A0A7W7ZK53_9BACT|nr:pyridoxamine 5'-phosphate oxidase family protein [Granulicella aggregans]MBB5061049.1 general stress protein 26 [Granulicella aggregans]